MGDGGNFTCKLRVCLGITIISIYIIMQQKDFFHISFN